MKKILSFIIAFTMVSTVVLTMFVGVSADSLAKSYAEANNGDLLYEANFSSTDGAFAPKVLTTYAETSDTVVTPSADGKSLNVSFTATSTKGFAWGAPIKGLAVTADTRYTVEFTWKDNNLDNCGVTFVTGNSDDPWASWHTLYGKTTSKSYNLNVSGTSQKGFPGVTLPLAADSDGYVTVKIELYGYFVRVYSLTSDGYKLSTTYRLNESEQEKANIACGMFCWTNANNATTLDIKSFKVTKGTPYTDASLAVDYTGVGLNSVYKNAKNGDLVWSANFSGDANFNPAAAGSSKREGTTITVSDGNKTLTVGPNDGGTAAAYYYAGQLSGLVMKDDTQYTVEFKLKNTGNYGGVIFYCSPDYLPDSYVSWYTAHDNNNTTIARGAGTSVYTANWQMKNAYVAMADRATDTDGYWDVKIEIDGYKITVYYKATSGEYKQAYSYISDEVIGVLACGVYNYQPVAVTTVKDFNVYKGLTLTHDYSQETDPVTTEPPTTTSPVTPSNPGTGDKTVIPVLLAVIAVAAAGAVVVTKKRHA